MTVALPRVTVFTATSSGRHLDGCLGSLLSQAFTDWEWVVVLYSGARWRPAAPDARIRLVIADDAAGIADAKRTAGALAMGDLLLELAPGDQLTSTALTAMVDALSAEDANFVFGDLGYLSEGQPAQVVSGFVPDPHNVSDPRFAPAVGWCARRSLYELVGGYEPRWGQQSDHELVLRMYERTDFTYLPECLYLRRPPTEDPASLDVQDGPAAEAYDEYAYRAALAWSSRHGLLALDLGQRLSQGDGTGPEADILDELRALDLADSSVGVIQASDVLQHVIDGIDLFNECYRVLCHGGRMFTTTPSTDGRGGFQDPAAVSFYNENSFWYFSDPLRSTVAGVTCHFQPSMIRTTFPSDWHREHSIPYVEAHLTAIKDGTTEGGADAPPDS